jgi:hypothetical protein
MLTRFAKLSVIYFFQLKKSDKELFQSSINSNYNHLRDYLATKKGGFANENAYSFLRKETSDEKLVLIENEDEKEIADDEASSCYEVLNPDKKRDESVYDRLRYPSGLKNQFYDKLDKKNMFCQTVKRRLYYDSQEIKGNKVTCLTEIKPASLFATQSDGVAWYFGLLSDTMKHYIKECKNFDANEQDQRINMINAHQLYAKNLYEMRIATSKTLRTLLKPMHPCTIAMSCLLDSDAIRICDTHNCSYDSCVYLFSTKIKFCAWKTKYYLILKKPKRSSLERLNLIENLINCNKLLNDRSLV